MSLNPIALPSLPPQDTASESPSLALSSLSIINVSSPHSRSASPARSASPTPSTTSSENEDDLVEQEWQESLAQLALLFNLVLLPFAGKYFGRKFAYWVWARWMEYRWPVEVVFTSKKTFEAVGIAQAALS